ncbi:MAG TPA: DUF6516 family protein [Anaerolineae bacterium]|nr:DUF6516 family protein [Anaerolineae bacterium]HQI86613.1 DUF6516 family protein [Anaerolineae bacterium]
MNPDEYLASIHLALVENAVVERYQVVRQRVTSQSRYLRVRIELVNGDFLEAAEFFSLKANGINIIDYRHQWMDASRTQLRARWDNAPHHLTLNGAPHHCHKGDEACVVPGQPLGIQEILKIIANSILS